MFSVNDFDEAAIYDFGVDVLRIATSVCNHAHSNGLNNDEINAVLRAFTDTYVETLIHYVGGDRELLYELTPQTATGSLKTFLTSLETEESSKKQLKRFTDVDKKTGRRSFIKDDSKFNHYTPCAANKCFCVSQKIRFQIFLTVQYLSSSAARNPKSRYSPRSGFSGSRGEDSRAIYYYKIWRDNDEGWLAYLFVVRIL